VEVINVKRKNEIDKETQKAIDKAVIKTLFKMLYKGDLVDKEEYEKLLECTDKNLKMTIC
jgi:HSP90 family molecular chaperone